MTLFGGIWILKIRTGYYDQTSETSLNPNLGPTLRSPKINSFLFRNSDRSLLALSRNSQSRSADAATGEINSAYMLGRADRSTLEKHVPCRQGIHKFSSIPYAVPFFYKMADGAIIKLKVKCCTNSYGTALRAVAILQDGGYVLRWSPSCKMADCTGLYQALRGHDP